MFNFEGGCYAKLTTCRKKTNLLFLPRKHGTVLENIVLDSDGVPDFHDTSKTQNTRGSYPIEFMDNRTHDSQRWSSTCRT